jgi:hypothetical protein
MTNPTQEPIGPILLRIFVLTAELFVSVMVVLLVLSFLQVPWATSALDAITPVMDKVIHAADPPKPAPAPNPLWNSFRREVLHDRTAPPEGN